MNKAFYFLGFCMRPGTVYSQIAKPVGPAAKMDWWVPGSYGEFYLALLMMGLFLGILFFLWQGFDVNYNKYRKLYFAGALISLLLMITLGINSL